MTEPENEIWWGKGKYRGKKLKQIPSRYLYWIAENAYRDDLATAADQVWRERDRFNTHFEED